MMSAGRSACECSGTMPPGWISMCRKRSRRWSSRTFSFARSIEASSFSITPTGAPGAPGSALAPTLSAGHSPARAGALARIDTRPASRIEGTANAPPRNFVSHMAMLLERDEGERFVGFRRDAQSRFAHVSMVERPGRCLRRKQDRTRHSTRRKARSARSALSKAVSDPAVSARAPREAVDAARELRAHARRIVVNDHAFDRIDRRAPRRGGEHAFRVLVARFPPRGDARGGEVDVLRVVLAVELRRDQAHDVHRRAAAPRRELLRLRTRAHVVGQPLRELADHVAQVMDLLLACDVAARAARV